MAKDPKQQPVPNKPPSPGNQLPEMHPLPSEQVAGPEIEKNGYRQARQDITNPEDLKLVENFIGTIYGDAKRIDNSNVGSNQFTQGLKFDAKKEIIDIRSTVANKITPNQDPSSANIPPPPLQPQQPVAPVQQAQYTNPPVPPSHGDSLILKHEIDQMKEQLKDIKKLYDEFFKLKQIKGKWQIISSDKTQTAPSISKAWNILNKLLKNKSSVITIKYTEDE